MGPLPNSDGRPLSAVLGSLTEEQREFRELFNEASPRYANSMIILMIPLFAGALRLLRRRGLIVRDLVFSLHFFTFLLLLSVALTVGVGLFVLAASHLARATGASDVPALVTLFSAIDRALNSEVFATVIILLPVLAYLIAAIRTAYDDALPAAVLRGMAAMVLLFGVLTSYRAILFFVVFLTM